MLSLYKNIKYLRKLNHWSQNELALKMGYADKSAISKIENGKSDLPASQIVEFANLFGVSPGDLMGYDGVIDSYTDLEKKIIEKYRIQQDSAKTLILNALQIEEPQQQRKKDA